MTVCVPKKPFEVLGRSVLYSIIFSWIVTLPLGILDVIGITKILDSVLFLLFGGISLYGSLLVIYDVNKEKHWVQWCDIDKDAQRSRS